MIQLKQLSDVIVKDKVVLLRLDLNIPQEGGKITDNTRIVRTIPTIKYLILHGAKVVIISHLGNPKGRIELTLSLRSVVTELEALLNIKVQFCPESIGATPKNAIIKMKAGEVLLLENLRFNSGEELNDATFVNELSSLGDIYVNDAFSCSHRKHASIYGLPAKLPSAAGFLLLSELKHLTSIFSNANKPFTVIIGGAKMSTKLDLLNSLITKADYLIVAGAMANIFLAMKHFNIGASLYKPELVNVASLILKKATLTNCKIILPFDVVIQNFNNITTIELNSSLVMQSNAKIMDIGPKTIAQIINIIKISKTIIWNGPVGAFEQPPFDHGSTCLSKAIAEKTRTGSFCSVAGGGDTISAIKKSGVIDDFSYISTGGGAFLEWLQGKTLPGVEALMQKLDTAKYI
ncbi:phosphoglycerate kinase [Orientia tsutsugamushi]|uniref:phosphoglycerate kinase n=1 Tax=Orientia tsutsugamushi TaxID=784 RepID=UPI003527A4E2